METLKVSTKSNPNSVAGAVAGAVRQAGAVEIQIVGAGALNQAIKAVAIARGYVTASGIDLVCVPTFADILIDGERRTAIRLSIEDRSGRYAESIEGGPAAAANPPGATVAPPVVEPSESMTPAAAAAVELAALRAQQVLPAAGADRPGRAELAGVPVGGSNTPALGTTGRGTTA